MIDLPAPDPDTAVEFTWEGVPCQVLPGNLGTVIVLPSGHDALGYAPGSRFYGTPDGITR